MVIKQNKYSRWYFDIIRNAINDRNNREHIYTEKHHIWPKSIGGKDDTENLVFLTYREHWICHRLLPKMLICEQEIRSMNKAVSFMRRRNSTGVKLTARRAEVMRKAVIEALTGRIVSEETKQKNRKIGLAQRNDPDYMLKWNKAMEAEYIRRRTEESRSKCSAIAKESYKKGNALAKWNGSEEQKKHMSVVMKDRKFSDEHKNNISKAKKKNPFPSGNPMDNEESREKIRCLKLGTRGLYKDSKRKMALPGSDKWNDLVNSGWSIK